MIYNQKSLHSITIQDLSFDLHLGVTKEERSKKQEVRLTITLHFYEPPRAITTNNLSDTICYERLCDSLRTFHSGKEYEIIEKFAAETHCFIMERMGHLARVSLSLHKVRPPIDGLLGGAFYRIEAVT